MLLENVATDFASVRVGSRRDPRIKVHVIEVGYAGDWYVHERVKDKLDQHEQLRRNLRAFGWTSVYLHAFVLGHSGGYPWWQCGYHICDTQLGSMQIQSRPFPG